MGKDSVLNDKQRLILDAFSKERNLSSKFYFTGGTALAEYYLGHRKSVDLDFFSKVEFDPQIVLSAINSWSKKHNFVSKHKFLDPTHIYFLTFYDRDELKVDFAQYPYNQLEETTYHNGVAIDSFFDISVNKLLTLNQRTEVKDFVDLYFILKEFNFWELRDGVRAKFNIEIEPYIMAADYMKVNSFQVLPEMYKKISLNKLKDFFESQAKKLAGESVKR